MYGFLLFGTAILISALLSAIVAVREFRRRNYPLTGFALFCLGLCVATLFVPIKTHAVMIDLPQPDNGG